MIKFGRRDLLLGGAAMAAGSLFSTTSGAAPAAAIAAASSANAVAADYVKLLADVHADYVNGRVVVHEGWVLSEHEFAAIQARNKPAAPTTPGKPAAPAASGKPAKP